MLETQSAVVARDAVETVASREPAVQQKGGAWKHIVLLCAAPFIGLAYVLAFPFIGVGLLAWHGGRALLKRPKTR